MKKLLIAFAVVTTLSSQAQKVLIKQIDAKANVCDRITDAITVRYGYTDSIIDNKGKKVANITKQEFLQDFVINYLIKETQEHEVAAAGSVATKAKQLEFETNVKEQLKPKK
jgi:hypothetical protein